MGKGSLANRPSDRGDMRTARERRWGRIVLLLVALFPSTLACSGGNLAEAKRAAAGCPAGTTWDGAVCMGTRTCPPGARLEGTRCVADAKEDCAAGTHFAPGMGCVSDAPAAQASDAQDRAAEQAAGPPPSSFVLSSAEALIGGDADRIMGFVTWADTPQGNAFWIKEKKRLENGQGLSPAAKAAVEAWIRQAKRAGQ